MNSGFTMNEVSLSQSSLSEGFTGYEKCCFSNSWGQISKQSQRGFPRQGFLSFVRAGQAGRGKTPNHASHHRGADRKFYFPELVERHTDLFSWLLNNIPASGKGLSSHFPECFLARDPTVFRRSSIFVCMTHTHKENSSTTMILGSLIYNGGDRITPFLQGMVGRIMPPPPKDGWILTPRTRD